MAMMHRVEFEAMARTMHGMVGHRGSFDICSDASCANRRWLMAEWTDTYDASADPPSDQPQRQ